MAIDPLDLFIWKWLMLVIIGAALGVAVVLVSRWWDKKGQQDRTLRNLEGLRLRGLKRRR
jgi:NhaP-type Na+/H+ or K+/H+ antiporter